MLKAFSLSSEAFNYILQQSNLVHYLLPLRNFLNWRTTISRKTDLYHSTMNLSLKITGNTIIEEDDFEPSEMDYLIEIVNLEDKSPLLLSLPFSIRYLVAAFLLVSMLIGSYFKFLLYRFIFVSSKLNNGSYFKMTPINSMILNSAIIHHLTHLPAGLSLVMIIGTDIVPEQILGSEYCKLIFVIGNELLHFSVYLISVFIHRSRIGISINSIY